MSALAFCILLNQRERNKAIGIAHDTQFLRGLSDYAVNQTKNEVNDEISRIARTAYLKSAIEEHSALAKKLTDHIIANIEDEDTRNEGVYIMKELEAYIHLLGEELDNLWQH